MTVQAMVFGNRGADSATGVAFTRNPATGEPVLYGDVLFDAQGEDVVAGTHATDRSRSSTSGCQPSPQGSARSRRASSITTRTSATSSSRSSRAAVAAPGPGRQAQPQAALRIAVDMAEDPRSR